MESSQVFFVLASASQGLKGEAALRAAGISCALVPAPRTLTSQCGVCLRASLLDRERAQAVLAQSGIAISAVHEIEELPSRTTGSGKETR